MIKQNLELKIRKEYSINDMNGKYHYDGVCTLKEFSDIKGNKKEFYIFTKEEVKGKKIDKIIQIYIYKDSSIKVKKDLLIVPEEDKVISYIDSKKKWNTFLKCSLNSSYFKRLNFILNGGEKIRCHRI